MLLGLLPLFILAHFTHHLMGALLTPLLPFIRNEFALDYTQVGGLVSAFTIAYGVSQLPGGWLADRLGARLLIVIGVSGVALFGLLVGLSVNYLMMLIFLVFMGLLGGGYHPAASPLISDLVDPNRRGRALGIHQIGGTASYFLAPLIAAGIAAALGWRGSFITVASITMIFGIILYVLLGRQLHAGEVKVKPITTTAVAAFPGQRRRLVAFLVMAIMTQALLFSLLQFIPLFTVDNFGVSEEVGAAMLALATSAGFWGGPLGGYISDRLGKVRLALGLCFIAGPFVFLLNLSSLGWSISAVLIIIGMAHYTMLPIAESFLISKTSERNRSTVLGVYYLCSRGGPGLIAPVMGYIIDHYGFYTNFALTGAVLLIVTLGCAAFLWSSRD